MRLKVLNSLRIICLICCNIVCMGQSKTDTTLFKQLITGRWITIEGRNTEIDISKTKWSYYYKKQKNSNAYFFLHNSKDTIGVIFEQQDDTLIYHIESVDSFYLTLNYLGMGVNKDNWSKKIIDFRRK
jgi:hypothetical protein